MEAIDELRATAGLAIEQNRVNEEFFTLEDLDDDFGDAFDEDDFDDLDNED